LQFLWGFKEASIGLSPETVNRKAFDILEGRAIPSTRAEATFIQYVRKTFDDIIKIAEDIKVQATLQSGAKRVVRARQNYAPHIIDPVKLSTKAGQEAAIEHLVRTGQANDIKKAKALVSGVDKSESELFLKAFQYAGTEKKAEMMLNKFVQRQKLGGAFFGNLSYTRTLDLPPEVLITDMNELATRYVTSARQFLEHYRQFGAKNEKLAPLLKGIAIKKGEHAADFAKQYINILTGGNQREILSQWAVNSVKTFETITKLDLAFIGNATQTFFSTLPKGGIINTIKAIRSLPEKESKRFALESGAVVEMVTRKMLADIGGTKLGETFLSK